MTAFDILCVIGFECLTDFYNSTEAFRPAGDCWEWMCGGEPVFILLLLGNPLGTLDIKDVFTFKFKCLSTVTPFSSNSRKAEQL